MNVVGVLSWFDESPSWLAASVAGFARVCDYVVACDGAYELYPSGRACSHPEQAEAIVATCEAAGVSCVVHRPRVRMSEVAKRNLTLRLASAFDPDWVVVFDADFQVVECRPEIVRAELAASPANVVRYTIREFLEVPLIYRWTDDLRYEGNHFTVRGSYDGVEESLRDDADFDCLRPDTLSVIHRERAQARREAAAGYQRLREATGIEAVAC